MPSLIHNKGAWYALAVVFVSLFAVVAINISYTNKVANETRKNTENNIQRFCALVSTLDAAYSNTPPQTETGKLVAKEMHDLRRNLGC